MTKKWRTILLYLIIAVFLLLALFPIYWILITSMKTGMEIYSMKPTFWPKTVTFDSYVKIFVDEGFMTNIINSFWVSVTVSLISIIVSIMAAYAIARLKFKRNRMVLKGIFYSYIMPRSIMFIPLYMLAVIVGLGNSIYGLILIYPTITIPYATWMLVSYFRSIPIELEEAALIDGCSRIQSMIRIVFPLALPGIVSVLIISFTLCWNEYLYAFILINKKSQMTITLGLSELLVDDMIPWGKIMSGSVMASIPAVILYYFSSRYLVSGMTMGAVKG